MPNLFLPTQNAIVAHFGATWGDECPVQLENRPLPKHAGNLVSLETCWGSSLLGNSVTDSRRQIQGFLAVTVRVPANSGLREAERLAVKILDAFNEQKLKQGHVTVVFLKGNFGNYREGARWCELVTFCPFVSTADELATDAANEPPHNASTP